jgi:hypothetical protein
MALITIHYILLHNTGNITFFPLKVKNKLCEGVPKPMFVLGPCCKKTLSIIQPCHDIELFLFYAVYTNTSQIYNIYGKKGVVNV